MAKRIDLAAPTVIDPAAFVFVAGVYFGSNPGEDFDALLGEWATEKGLNDDGKFGWYSKRPKVLEAFPPLNDAGNFVRKGTCDHCGARFDWGAVYQHTSGKHIVVGNVCADKTMDVPSRAELDVRRMKSQLEAQRKAFKATVAACEQAIAGGFVWLYAEAHTNPTLADIAYKGLTWGGLTARQVEFINRIRYGVKAQWELDRDAREAARAAEEAAAQPVPVTSERIQVKGVVLTTKEQAGYFPGESVIKMLVKTDAGWKVWGTRPSCIDIKKGVRVEFMARVERSPDDPKFGYFSRPTKVNVTPEATAA